MGIIDTVDSKTTLALDTNIFIYAYHKSDNQGDLAREFLARIKQGESQVFISVIVFEEFLVKIYKQKLEKNISEYEDFITAGGLITVTNMDRQIARVAAKIRAEFAIKAPDAIHLASAIESGAKVFITTDRRLPKKIGKLVVKVLV